jgi:hypothetical protein
MKKLLVCSFAIAMVLGLMLAPAQATPYIDDGGIGDLLLFSLYDVRVNLEIEGGVGDGTGTWENFIAIENTSGAWTAFHLRFRAWKKSIEVWDHVILLSPFDVFWMVLTKDDDKGVQMYSGDTETLYNSALIWDLTKVVNNETVANDWTDYLSAALLEKNGFCQDEVDAEAKQACLNNELRTGYIEAIGMFQLEIPLEACSPEPDSGICTEDTHSLSAVVKDINVVTGPTGQTAINVLDVLDALFFEYLTRPHVAVGNEYFIGNLNASLAVYAAWPYYKEIQITTYNEAPSLTRLGLDCGNVLTGVVFMTDEDTGRLQQENFIAVRDFRLPLDPNNFTQPYYTYLEGPACDPAGDEVEFPETLNPQDCVWQNDGGSLWQHRDGYHGGIFYPAAGLKWFYGFQRASGDLIDADWIFAGGTDATFFWPYIHPGVTTVFGPTLRDGDDLVGTNWNDVYAGTNDAAAVGPYVLFSTGLPVDFYGYFRPLGANPPLPNNWENPGYFVHYLNDIWSLDDIELALQKADIWYTHWTTRFGEDGAGITTNTDVVLTYPTKHEHWFFADWPLMWKWGAPLNSLSQGAWIQYVRNLNDYRGDLIAEPWDPNATFGYKDIEEYFPNAFDNPTQPRFNQTGMTYSEWFGDSTTYTNGPIYAEAMIWDMNQRLATNGNAPAPPPSPWPPSPQAETIPHEVNIIRVGSSVDHTGIGIGEAYALLELANKYDDTLVDGISYPWRKGHFRISLSEVRNGQRSYGMATPLDFPEGSIYASDDGEYWLPPIGVVIQSNESSGGDACQTIRSGMAEWHYVEYDVLD